MATTVAREREGREEREWLEDFFRKKNNSKLVIIYFLIYRDHLEKHGAHKEIAIECTQNFFER